MNIKEIPLADRPRERLKTHGAHALSTVELLAIILSTGTKEVSVMDLAAKVLSYFGSLSNLMEASIEELLEIDGIGPAKAVQLKAALGLAHKAALESQKNSFHIQAEEAYQLVRFEFESLSQEALFVILKDVRGRLIGVERVSIGTLSEVLIHPREVFFPAVRRKANSLILAHNHPSGDSSPSLADLAATRHLLQSAKVMGITLEDHLIVGAGSYTSLREAGAFGK